MYGKQEICIENYPEKHVVQQERISVSAQIGGIIGLLYIFSPAPSHIVPCFLSFRKRAIDTHENLLHSLFL